MSGISVDRLEAERVLRKALVEARKIKSGYLRSIDPSALIIMSKADRTRKYIFLTNIVAKITNPKIHSRALQVSSSLNGAYDARQFCKNVIRPFVLESLNNVWGGGADPLVNNPGRHAEVSIENPCKGNLARQILEHLVEYLEKANLMEKSRLENELCLILKYLIDSSSVPESSTVRELRGVGDQNIYAAAIRFSEKTIGGETSALLSDVCLALIFGRIDKGYKVTSHPVNRSDASPDGILDSDVLIGGKSFLSVEVKDRSIIPTEISSLKNKAFSRGLTNLGIILGPKASAPPGVTNSVPTINIRSLVALTATVLGCEFQEKFIQELQSRLRTKGVSDACRKYATACFGVI